MNATTIRLSLVLLFMVCCQPISAQAASLMITPLGGEQYRVIASGGTSSHVIGAKYALQEISDTGDTIVLTVSLIQHGNMATRTCWQWSATKVMSIPERIQQIELRDGDTVETTTVPGRVHSTTTADLNEAIAHGYLVEFKYAGENIVTRPQKIYRVAGDTWGAIVLCAAPGKRDKTKTRSFYIKQIAELRRD